MFPTANIIQRIVFLQCGGARGTGFTIEVDGRQFIVTARHVITHIRHDGSLEINRDGNWEGITVEVLPSSSDADIAVLDPGAVLTAQLPITASSGQIIYGQQVFFLGFPFGEPVGKAILAHGHPLAMVKHGIVAGFHTHRPGRHTWYLDGINNAGFSGAPVVFFTPGSNDVRVAAVVSGYRTETQPVMLADGTETDLRARYNSGIVIADDVGFALDDIANYQASR